MSSKTSTLHRILVVDDDPDITELLSYNLKKENYDVRTANDGKSAIEVAKEFEPELIILDIMMPELDGIETGRQLREIEPLKKAYLLYLTARSEEYSEVAAFDVGADDYLTKPIKPRALISRINAFFRREAERSEPSTLIEIVDLQINRENYTVTKGTEAPMVLPKKEFELLYYLAQRSNKVCSRDELLQKIWGTDVFVVERTVDVHVRKVREKIGNDYIKTLKGVGYMFSEEG
ncbi:MAG: two-component system alkaline phosphatase synthesis response regulator PhoP [Spirosomataceae bacterium]|jgi:two-component system alkaline phosphatase synthesis response regulator PhoP